MNQNDKKYAIFKRRKLREGESVNKYWANEDWRPQHKQKTSNLPVTGNLLLPQQAFPSEKEQKDPISRSIELLM